MFISAHRPWALFQRVLELAVALLLQHVVEKLCFRAGGPSLRGFRKGGGTTVSRIFISASCSSLQMAGSAVALPACRHGLSLAWRMGLLTSSVPTFAKAQRWANRRMKSYRVLKISRSRCDRECLGAGSCSPFCGYNYLASFCSWRNRSCDLRIRIDRKNGCVGSPDLYGSSL